DDYFYPYKQKLHPNDEDSKEMLPFPDDETYAKYKIAGGKLERDDWRRANINRMIQRLYEGVKAEKKWVKFGISPFGIPRPGLPGIESVRGFDQYTTLYADAALWLREGWCDYYSPQLYWRMGAANQSYLTLLRWWTENNPQH